LEAIEAIEESQAISGVDCNKHDFINRLILSVCLMVQEGSALSTRTDLFKSTSQLVSSVKLSLMVQGTDRQDTNNR
jgi:hypothetical protein